MPPRVGRYLIYGLLDPRDSSLRYVGKTHKRRELRLEDHILAAINGRTAPVCVWLRELLNNGLRPQIFVLSRIAPDADWRQAERDAIRVWASWPPSQLPYVHPPQTRKSTSTTILQVRLLNVQCNESSPRVKT